MPRAVVVPSLPWDTWLFHYLCRRDNWLDFQPLLLPLPGVVPVGPWGFLRAQSPHGAVEALEVIVVSVSLLNFWGLSLLGILPFPWGTFAPGQ